MKVVTTLVHMVVEDTWVPADLQRVLPAQHCVTFGRERTLENGMTAEIELGVADDTHDLRTCHDEGAVVRHVRQDLAQPDPDRSRRRWARIAELEAVREASYVPYDKKRKGQPLFGDTEEGEAVNAELRWLLGLERETACFLNWPVWQRTQHSEVLIDGVLMECAVIAFDIPARTVDVEVWAMHDTIASLKSGKTRHTVTVDQIEAGVAENERLDELAREARRTAPPPETKTKTKAKANAKPRRAPADLFTTVPGVE